MGLYLHLSECLYCPPPQLVQGLCQQLEDSLKCLTHCSIQEVQADILAAHEVLHNARESLKVQVAHLGLVDRNSLLCFYFRF